MNSEDYESNRPRVFPNTRWSLVLSAMGSNSPGSADALDALCRLYWLPLYAYVRRCGQSHCDAQDLTQEFFRCLIEKRWLEDADRNKGRLRSFLVVAMKNFLHKQWRRASAKKRGGGQAQEPFDAAIAESRYAEASQTLTPEETFDRQWALALLDSTLSRLRGEFAKAGKPDEFEMLKDCLAISRSKINYEIIGKRLGATEGAARVAVHRLRKRFRAIYREEISQTLENGADLDAEMRFLAAALARA